jgi:hypothetical protein
VVIAFDKPGADLVALLLQFEACARDGRMTSLYLSGDDAGAAIRAWADLRGHLVVIGKHQRDDGQGGRLEYSHYTVQDAGDSICSSWTVTCSLHDDMPATAPPAQADQQVIARVQAALDGEQPGAINCCVRCGSAMITTSAGERCLAGCQQPEAAKGSV